MTQADLFAPAAGAAPAGFRYQDDVLAPAAGAALVRRFEGLPLRPFQFHGYLGNRRVMSFGWRYDYGARALQRGADMPDFLMDPRAAAAAFAGIAAERFEHALVTEYAPGAGIGWHRDKAVFGVVAALSFLAPCTLRFRRRVGEGWARARMEVRPRSAYVLDGAARTEWEHSIPVQPALRYSVTFRTLAGSAKVPPPVPESRP